MNRSNPAKSLNGVQSGHICDRCNKGVRTGDPVRAYATHYEYEGWKLRRVYCSDCGETSIQSETDSADEVIVEAVFWDNRLVSVEVMDRSLPLIEANQSADTASSTISISSSVNPYRS
jgi:hypothetical protein